MPASLPGRNRAGRARIPAGVSGESLQSEIRAVRRRRSGHRFPAGPGLADSIVIVANHFLVEIAFYTALAFGMSTQAVAKRYMQAKIYIDRAAAAVLGALGVGFYSAGSLVGSFCLGQPSIWEARKCPLGVTLYVP